MQSSVVGLFCVCLLVIGSFPEGDAQFLARVLGFPGGQHQQGFRGQQYQQEYQPQQYQSQQYQAQDYQPQQYQAQEYQPQQYQNQQNQAQQYQPQQYQTQPVQQGSVSAADSEAYSRDVQLGNLIGLNGGIVKSESLTQDESGATNAARSTSLTRGLNVGKLGLSSTLTGSKAINNGQVSRGLTENLQIGKLGIEGSLSKDNLKNGLGLHRSEDGRVELGLGLLNIDLSRNKQQPTAGQTGTNAQVQAVGSGANVNSLSNTDSQTEQFGKLTSTATHSKSSAIGSVLKGFTSGNAGGFAGGAPSYAGNQRFIRQTDFYFPGQQFNQNPGFFPGGGPQQRPGHRRQQKPQHQSGQFGQPQFNQPQFNQPQFANNNANAQGVANNQNALSQQQAGANTQNQNIVNEFGQFVDNTGSSIASNIANDGKSGQLGAANTAQQSYQTAQGSGNKNAAQSQSLNFDKDSTQGTASNADTSHTKTADSERDEANSGAVVNQQTQFGNAANSAKTHSTTFNEAGREGSENDANSQSTITDPSGALNSALAGANTQSIKGPDGTISNNAASQASAFSNNGAPASASASSSSGFGPNGAFNNAQGLANTNNAGANALTQSGLGGGRRGQQQFFAFGFRRKRQLLQANPEPRTFDTIFNLFAGLFTDTSCNQCNFYIPTNQKNCCPQCCNFPPQPLPQPLPPPPPPMMPPPPRPLPPPAVQITPPVFNPWFYQRPCCPTCAPQIGAFPCGRGYGRPFPPPPFYYSYYG